MKFGFGPLDEKIVRKICNSLEHTEGYGIANDVRDWLKMTNVFLAEWEAVAAVLIPKKIDTHLLHRLARDKRRVLVAFDGPFLLRVTCGQSPIYPELDSPFMFFSERDAHTEHFTQPAACADRMMELSDIWFMLMNISTPRDEAGAHFARILEIIRKSDVRQGLRADLAAFWVSIRDYYMEDGIEDLPFDDLGED